MLISILITHMYNASDGRFDYLKLVEGLCHTLVVSGLWMVVIKSGMWQEEPEILINFP